MGFYDTGSFSGHGAKNNLTYCKIYYFIVLSIQSIAVDQVLSLPCDRFLGTESRIPTFLTRELLNLSLDEFDQL